MNKQEIHSGKPAKKAIDKITTRKGYSNDYRSQQEFSEQSVRDGLK